MIQADFNYKRRKVSGNKNIFQKLQHIKDESKRREIFAQTLLEVKRKSGETLETEDYRCSRTDSILLKIHSIQVLIFMTRRVF